MASRLHPQTPGMDGVLHPLDPGDPYVSLLLCYPEDRCARARILAETLSRIGVEALVETGGTILRGHRFLGKGLTGIVAAAIQDRRPAALKIRRLDARRSGMCREAVILEYLRPARIAPEPYSWGRDYILMELLSCRDLARHLETLDEKRLAEETRRALVAAYLLDTLHIDHGELVRPWGHVVACRDGPRFLDFESASYARKPRNLPSLASYLFYKASFAHKLRELTGDPRPLLSMYKHGRRAEALKMLLRRLSQASVNVAETI